MNIIESYEILTVTFFTKGTMCIPQQIFIPGLSISNSQSNHQFQESQNIKLSDKHKEQKSQTLSILKNENMNKISFPYQLNENQLNNLYNLFNKNSNENNSNNNIIKLNYDKQSTNNNPIGKIKQESFTSTVKTLSSKSLTASNLSLTKNTVLATPIDTNFNAESYASSTKYPFTHTFPLQSYYETNDQKIKHPNILNSFLALPNNIINLNDFDKYSNSPVSINTKSNTNINNNNINIKEYVPFENMVNTNLQLKNIVNNEHYNDCSENKESRRADKVYCNLYHLCSKGVFQAVLCPEGYLFSTSTLKCEKKIQVNCNDRLSLEFDHSTVTYLDLMNEYYNSASNPRIVNGSLQCSLGTDGYFADPEFCNIYHHCLAGVDYAEQCPHQLVWNDRKKMYVR